MDSDWQVIYNKCQSVHKETLYQMYRSNFLIYMFATVCVCKMCLYIYDDLVCQITTGWVHKRLDRSRPEAAVSARVKHGTASWCIYISIINISRHATYPYILHMCIYIYKYFLYFCTCRNHTRIAYVNQSSIHVTFKVCAYINSWDIICVQ